MSVSRLSNRNRSDYTWPGFVDALASLLMVFVFVLMVFVLIQANLAYRLSGQDASLSALRSELSTLSSLLGQERQSNAALTAELNSTKSALATAQDNILSLSSSLAESEATAADQLAQLQALNAKLTAQAADAEKLSLSLADKQALLAAARAALAEAEGKLADTTNKLSAIEIAQVALQSEKDKLATELATSQTALQGQQTLNEESQLEIERLIAATLTLRNELDALRSLLAEKEAQALADKVTIASLGKSLNQALASRVQELQRFKSDFFGRLRDILGKRNDVTIVGDRFIFQSEVLFGQGQANLGQAGKDQLQEIGRALMEISETIPDDIPWVLQVDGHTDDVPVSGVYADNWQLSTERALSVVRFLIDQGVPAERLAATGYGEFQPIDTGTSNEARSRNRRIELKFTQRFTKKPEAN
ncbi:MAG: OmpA family protein [Candidatus Puniceispirillaceae bacterium]